MNSIQTNAASLAGRILVALIFVTSGYGKIGGFSATAAYMASKGMPIAEVLLVGAIVIELLGGIMLIAGWKTRWAAAALIVFLIPATLIFHGTAGLDAQAARGQMIHFMKNLSIAGAMLLLIAFGPGAWSVDGRKRRAA
jgi:putative oxidoreductase